NLEIRSVCNDSKGRIWVSALGDGIAILNETTGQFKKVPRDTSLSPAVKSNYINQLYSASDGNIWVVSNNGMYTIDPATLKINPFTSHPVLKQISGTRVTDFLEDGQDGLWISSFAGVFYYNRRLNKLDHYTVKEGLSSNQCYNMVLDRKGNLYVSTIKGFSVIANGLITK